MLTLHPTLLIGPSDWQPERMPKEEFERRIAALWQTFPQATRAIVYGSPAHHAELAYLSNLVPKLEAGVALLSRDGKHKLLLGGGPNMLGAARPLTFIGDLAPLRGGVAIGQAAAQGGGEVLLIGTGYMPTALRHGMIDAMGGAVTTDVTPRLWQQMRHKSPHELAAVREACAMLQAAMMAIAEAHRAGATVTAAVLAGERAANAHGAQDVRTLFSLDGGCTLQPFTASIDRRVDPLQVYAAVRHLNYWAEGLAPLSAEASSAKSKAGSVLRRALGAIKGGVRMADVVSLVNDAVRPDHIHPVTDGTMASAIGLALDEAPHTAVGDAFTTGEVYSVRIGVSGDNGDAIVSAMIVARHDGNDVLWSDA